MSDNGAALFVRLLKTAGLRDDGCREDFLTECFAGALRRDPLFSRMTWEVLTGHRPDVDVGVECQRRAPGSRIDLVLSSDTRAVAVEIKLYAAQGDGQLAKYLSLEEFDHVAFLTAYPAVIDSAVRAHAKYLRPRRFDHFLWHDLFDVLPADEAPWSLTLEFKDLLRHLKLAPPAPDILGLTSDDEHERKLAAVDFMKLYRPIAADLAAAGWRGEIAVPPRFDRVGPPGSAVSLLSLEVDAKRGDFTVAAYLASKEQRDRTASRLSAAGLPVIQRASQARSDSRRYVVEVRTALTSVVHHSDPSGSMHRIAKLAHRVIDAAGAREADGPRPSNPLIIDAVV
jgi:hypothetical protein